jgi:hypothetical protein
MVSPSENGDSVDLDEHALVDEALDLHHRRGWRLARKIFAAHRVDRIELVDVENEDVDPRDVRHGAAGRLDRGLEVLADLPCLSAIVVMPEMKSRRPGSQTIAGDQTPAGFAIDGGAIGVFLIMASSPGVAATSPADLSRCGGRQQQRRSD